MAQSPRNEHALLLAARAARRSDAYADAEKYLTAFEEVERPTEASRLEWTLLGVQQGDFGEDEDRLRVAVGRNHPEEPAILEALAKGYIAAQRWQEAIQAVERLLARDPDHIPGLILRAAAAERFRAADAAEKDLRRAIEKDPENAAAQSALAELLNRRGHTRDAIYHFELALRSRPGHSATRLGLVRALLDNAELLESERQLDELLKTEPDSTAALSNAPCRASTRASLEAERFVTCAIQVASWNRDANQFHLLILKHQNRSDALAACEKRLAELKAEDAESGRLKLRARDTPSDTAIRMNLVAWAIRNGDREEEIAWLTEIIRIDAKHAGAHAAFADYFERVISRVGPRYIAKWRKLEERVKGERDELRYVVDSPALDDTELARRSRHRRRRDRVFCFRAENAGPPAGRDAARAGGGHQ